jgi:2-deoxy-D-gluconate 3-dehydrogenase
VLAARNKTKAQAALSELRAIGAEAEFTELDVLDERSCREAVQRTANRFGRLDILVNNAGTTVRKQPELLTAQDWRLVMDTNLTSAFLCSQAAYPHMVRAGGGKIINIGSMMTIFASSYAAPYAASKGGIVQLARSMAVAWAKDNIQVNAAGSTPISPDKRASRCRALTKESSRALRRNAGARPTIFPALQFFSLHPPQILLPVRPFRSTADIPYRHNALPDDGDQIGLSPMIVQRRITRTWFASSNPVARCNVQRLSHTRHWRGAQRWV